MSETPDLSKIVSLIMQNPNLISEISALASKSSEENTEGVEESVASTEPHTSGKRLSRSERRVKLLGAMKPYLGEQRARSIDTVLTIADMLDAVRRE